MRLVKALTIICQESYYRKRKQKTKDLKDGDFLINQILFVFYPFLGTTKID